MTTPAPGTSRAAQPGTRTLVVVVLATALIVIDTTIIGVALTDLRREYPSELDVLQWVVVGYAVTFGALILPTASLSDRVGRRRLFLLGIAVFTAASVGCAAAWSLTALDVARVVQGVGAGMIFATAVPLVAAAYPEARRPGALAIWAAAAGSCSVAGPFLGGVLVELGGWRAVFAVNVPLGAIVLALAPHWLPWTGTGGRGDDRLRAAEWLTIAALTAGLLMVFSVVNAVPRQGWSATSVALAVIGVGALLVVGRHQLRVTRPMVDLRLLRRRRYAGAATLSFLTRFTTMAVPLFLVLYLQAVLGASPFLSGLVLVPMFAAAFAGGLTAGRTQQRFGVAPVVGTGFALAALGAAATAAVISPSTPMAVVAAALVPFGLGFGLSSTPLIAVAVAAAPPERAGTASGLANLLIPLGTAAGTATWGVVYGAADGAAGPLVAAGAARVMLGAAVLSALAVGLTWWSLRRRDPSAGDGSAAAASSGSSGSPGRRE